MAVNERAIAEVLLKHMPGGTVIFVTSPEGIREAVAFTGPAEPFIADYRRRGYRVDTGQVLKEVS
jgi:hypothetical protein